MTTPDPAAPTSDYWDRNRQLNPADPGDLGAAMARLGVSVVDDHAPVGRFWRYRVIEVEGTKACAVGDLLIDRVTYPPDGPADVRQWDIFNTTEGKVTGWIVGEPAGEYAGPFGPDGRPTSATDNDQTGSGSDGT